MHNYACVRCIIRICIACMHAHTATHVCIVCAMQVSMHACMLYDCMNDERVKVCIDECVKKCTHPHAQNLIPTEFVRNPTALLSSASFDSAGAY